MDGSRALTESSETEHVNVCLPEPGDTLRERIAMYAHTIVVDHVIGLDGGDQGPAAVTIGPSGEILTVRPERPADLAKTNELTAIPLLADSHAHLAISDGATEQVGFHTLACVDAQ